MKALLFIAVGLLLGIVILPIVGPFIIPVFAIFGCVWTVEKLFGGRRR